MRKFVRLQLLLRRWGFVACHFRVINAKRNTIYLRQRLPCGPNVLVGGRTHISPSFMHKTRTRKYAGARGTNRDRSYLRCTRNIWTKEPKFALRHFFPPFLDFDSTIAVLCKKIEISWECKRHQIFLVYTLWENGTLEINSYSFWFICNGKWRIGFNFD